MVPSIHRQKYGGVLSDLYSPPGPVYLLLIEHLKCWCEASTFRLASGMLSGVRSLTLHTQEVHDLLTIYRGYPS